MKLASVSAKLQPDYHLDQSEPVHCTCHHLSKLIGYNVVGISWMEGLAVRCASSDEKRSFDTQQALT